MAVPCRNRRLFRRVFRSHRCVQSVVLLNFREGRRSYMLRKLIRYSCIYEASMSPTLNRSSAIRRFERSDAIEIRYRITFDFYTGLPHIYTIVPGAHGLMYVVASLLGSSPPFQLYIMNEAYTYMCCRWW